MFPTSGVRRGWDGRRHTHLCGLSKSHLVLICPLPGVPHLSLPSIRCCSLPLTLVAPSLTVSHPLCPCSLKPHLSLMSLRILVEKRDGPAGATEILLSHLPLILHPVLGLPEVTTSQTPHVVSRDHPIVPSRSYGSVAVGQTQVSHTQTLILCRLPDHTMWANRRAVEVWAAVRSSMC